MAKIKSLSELMTCALLSLGGAAVGLLLLEAMLRIIPNDVGYAENGLVRLPWFNAELQFDPAIGFWPKPSQILRKSASCFVAERISFNSLGMRSSWEPSDGDNRPTIAVLGDSYMQALQVEDTEHFSVKLARALNERYRVLNFGVAGTGTLQHLLIYRHRVASLNPKVVILAFFVGNDLLDTHPHLASCHSGRDTRFERPWLNQNNEIILPQRTHKPDDGGAHFFEVLSHRSILLTALFNHISQRQTTSSTFACESFPASPEAAYLGAFISSQDRFWEEAWEDIEFSFRSLKGEIEGAGAQFLVAIIPQMWIPDKNRFVDTFISRHPELEAVRPSFDPDYPRQRVSALLDRLSIDYIDLESLFREAQNRDVPVAPEALTFECNKHWSPIAHEIAAQGIAKMLKP